MHVVRHPAEGENLAAHLLRLALDAAVRRTEEVPREPRFTPLRRPHEVKVDLDFAAPHPLRLIRAFLVRRTLGRQAYERGISNPSPTPLTHSRTLVLPNELA